MSAHAISFQTSSQQSEATVAIQTFGIQHTFTAEAPERFVKKEDMLTLLREVRKASMTAAAEHMMEHGVISSGTDLLKVTNEIEEMGDKPTIMRMDMVVKVSAFVSGTINKIAIEQSFAKNGFPIQINSDGSIHPMIPGTYVKREYDMVADCIKISAGIKF